MLPLPPDVIIAAIVAVTGVAAYFTGRRKTNQDVRLVTAQARRAEVEADQVEREDTFKAITQDLTTKMDAFDSRLDTIQHEVTPNHGGSMKDVVRRVEINQDAISLTLSNNNEILRNIMDGMTDIRHDLQAERDERREDGKIQRELVASLEDKANKEHEEIRKLLM